MKRLLVSLIVGLVFIMNMTVAYAAGTPSFDTAELENGIIALSCTLDTDARLKVMIEKSGEKLTYDLKNDGSTEYFPLQMGDGKYKVSVLENVGGTKYKYLSTQNIELNLSDDKQVFLASVQNVSWSYDMEAIRLAEKLTAGMDTEGEKIDVLYNYLVSNVSYDYDKLNDLKYDYLPDIDETVASGKGICYDYASTFAAMLRSQGIPAKLVKGYSPDVNGYHAWNEVYNSDTGKWVTIDATYDAQMKAAKKGYKMEKSRSEYSKVYEY